MTAATAKTREPGSRNDSRGFRSLLVPVDLAAGSERVVGRAALLPLAAGARVTLLHVIPARMEPQVASRAAADARKALAGLIRAVRRRLPRGAVAMGVVETGAAAAAIARQAASTRAELIVMGRGQPRPARDLFLGSTAERVVRQGRLPVLVVRLPARGVYRRPVAALDVDQAAAGVVTLLARVLPPPRPTVGLIHAYEPPYHGLVYPSLTKDQAREYRRRHRRQALRELAHLASLRGRGSAGTEPAEPLRWKAYVRHGSARLVIERVVARAGADLLALGTRARAGVAQAFLGTVAGDVLRAVACDVLVAPPRRPGGAAS